MTEITLASASPIRAALLRNAGLSFAVRPAEMDERAAEAAWFASGGSSDHLAEHLAVQKAEAAIAKGGRTVIGADQTLHLDDGAPLPKVGDIAEARDRLRRMRGSMHRLRTGAAVLTAAGRLWRTTVETRIHMRRYDHAELDAYLDGPGADALGSVACYQLEGPGLQLVERIEGDYFAALGLPLLWTLHRLREAGALGEGSGS